MKVIQPAIPNNCKWHGKGQYYQPGKGNATAAIRESYPPPLTRARIAVPGVSDATTFRTPAIGAMRCWDGPGKV